MTWEAPNSIRSSRIFEKKIIQLDEGEINRVVHGPVYEIWKGDRPGSEYRPVQRLASRQLQDITPHRHG
jgi:hypothetical protein